MFAWLFNEDIIGTGKVEGSGQPAFLPSEGETGAELETSRPQWYVLRTGRQMVYQPPVTQDLPPEAVYRLRNS